MSAFGHDELGSGKVSKKGGGIFCYLLVEDAFSVGSGAKIVGKDCLQTDHCYVWIQINFMYQGIIAIIERKIKS